jgi:transcription termination factor Rho
MWILRKWMSSMNSIEVMEELKRRLVNSKSNKDFLKQMELSNIEGL